MLQKNTGAFSIILAMILTTIMLLVAYNLLEMIVPFAKNTKGIENSSNAYYQSYAGVEESINFIAKNSVGSSTGKTMPRTATGYSITMISSGTIVPRAGKGNSEYDKNWNRIAPGEPLQLYVKGTQNWQNFKFRIPDLDNNISTTETLSGGTLGIINWQLSGSGFTLNSSGSQLIATDINNSISSPINLNLKDGLDLNNNGYKLGAFYSSPSFLNNCNGIDCSLKLSIINPLITNSGIPIPYLEYQISFQTSVPQQYVDINIDGKSYGFKKTINTKYRVNTTSEAFDFTVFQ